MAGFSFGNVGFVGSLGGGAVVAPESATYRYNMGGPSYTDPAGNVWAPLSNGQALDNPAALVSASTEPGIYPTLIYGSSADGGPAFTITGLPNGNYRARAYLRESSSPARNFALQVAGGATLIAAFNVLNAAGGYDRPLIVTASVLAPVTAGSLSLTMTETNMTLYGLTLAFVP